MQHCGCTSWLVGDMWGALGIRNLQPGTAFITCMCIEPCALHTDGERGFGCGGDDSGTTPALTLYPSVLAEPAKFPGIAEVAGVPNVAGAPALNSLCEEIGSPTRWGDKLRAEACITFQVCPAAEHRAMYVVSDFCLCTVASHDRLRLMGSLILTTGRDDREYGGGAAAI